MSKQLSNHDKKEIELFKEYLELSNAKKQLPKWRAYEGMPILPKKVWTNHEDWIVATCAQEAMEWSMTEYGVTEDECGPVSEWVLETNEIRIWEDHPGNNELTKTPEEWAEQTTVVPSLLCSIHH